MRATFNIANPDPSVPYRGTCPARVERTQQLALRVPLRRRRGIRDRAVLLLQSFQRDRTRPARWRHRHAISALFCRNSAAGLLDPALIAQADRSGGTLARCLLDHRRQHDVVAARIGLDL